MLRSLGLGLGLETFVKFLRVSVSVSDNLVSEKKTRFWFRKNLVSEKSLGFGFGKFGLGRKVSVSVPEKFCLGKKSRFQKIWYRKKKSQYRFRSKFWYRHSVLLTKVHGTASPDGQSLGVGDPAVRIEPNEPVSFSYNQ